MVGSEESTRRATRLLNASGAAAQRGDYTTRLSDNFKITHVTTMFLFHCIGPRVPATPSHELKEEVRRPS